MGNTPSNENGFDRDAFIEEQKNNKKQNEQIQIQKLASIAQNNINSNFINIVQINQKIKN